MTLHPHPALEPFKRIQAARGRRAPRVPSIVGSFCRLPSLVSFAGSVGLEACHLALAAAQASRATIREDAQNDNKPATTRDWPAAVETAEPSPRCDEPTQLFHGGWSDSPAR